MVEHAAETEDYCLGCGFLVGEGVCEGPVAGEGEVC